MDFSRVVWLEDESRSIGGNWIPNELYDFMRVAPVIKLEIDKKERIKNLMEDYADFDRELLKKSLLKITKRLGGNNVKLALESLKNGELDVVADISLTYYDKAYTFGLEKRETESIFPHEYKSNKESIEELIKLGKSIVDKNK